ncbi:hypothetical protein BHM03_00014684 [Ensete ventricosum]|nr:hypothetical protein BHM03_00014684 [Ensete ventricosum]
MAISASASAYVGARIKVEEEVVRRVKVEEEVDGEEFGDGDNSNNHYKYQQQPEEEEETGPAERCDSFAAEKAAEQLLMTRPWKRRRAVGRLGPKPLLSQNRHRLSRLLDRLARAHSWKEASGTLSALLKGTPRASTLLEDRRNFLFLVMPVSTNIVIIWHKAHSSWRGTYVNPCKAIRTVCGILVSQKALK